MPSRFCPNRRFFSGRLIRHQLCLSKLVDRAAAGEEIIIAKAGKPKADIADDFDRPLAPELQNYFE